MAPETSLRVAPPSEPPHRERSGTGGVSGRPIDGCGTRQAPESLLQKRAVKTGVVANGRGRSGMWSGERLHSMRRQRPPPLSVHGSFQIHPSKPTASLDPRTVVANGSCDPSLCAPRPPHPASGSAESNSLRYPVAPIL